jgi:putative hydrolase of the HAD superfamily
VPVELKLLADCSEWTHLLATWFYEEWGHRRPGNTVDQVERRVAKRMNRNALPITWVALKGAEPVGSASLILREMETHPRYLHWLAGVYVDQSFRGRGLGSRIVQLAAVEAQWLGIRELYIYTRSHELFYSRLGWKSVERAPYHGREVVIMVRDLSPEPANRSF